ncbi:MAG: hypothetical protein KDH96_11500, partial [Candidatus Riesia sp.]|nr:hypothetical protein [Candidatus Riesia sp.]
MTLLTTEQFKQVVPNQFKACVSQELIDQINKTLADPDMYETYRDNLLGYAHVMKEGKFKMEDYINAIKYCSHKIMGASNIDAYVKTFPDKYQAMLSAGKNAKD